MHNNNLSICIPLVDNKITKSYIKNILKRYKFGEIYKIDLIKYKQNKRAFIHYKYWYDNKISNYVQSLLNENKDFKIIYNKPWYWKCVKNYS
jgi:hypothetical protein